MDLINAFVFMLSVHFCMGKIFWPPRHHDFQIHNFNPQIQHSKSHPAFRTQFNTSEYNSKHKIRNTEESFRLPKNIIPVHYSLSIIPILEKDTTFGQQWTAPGVVEIKVNCVNSTKTIILHALRLDIAHVKVTHSSTRKSLTIKNHKVDENRQEFYKITTSEVLQPGNEYNIYIQFTAPIHSHTLVGMYRSTYYDPVNRQARDLVSTQFESYHAREVFPCFDEPALKATFDLRVAHTEKYTVVANTELISDLPMENEHGWRWAKFNTSVPMSTYLVAILVSDYKWVEADRNIFNGKPVRVYGPDFLIQAKQGDFAATTAAKLLAFYEKYFEVEYPLAKMDSVAIPAFYHGAMENFGANFYKDRYLMNPPGKTTSSHKESTVSILAHELAHQWFGNLVTCKWWDNIWLNEGFATYYSYVGENATYPENEPMKRMLVEATQYAMRLDTRSHYSYPILLDVESPEELEDRLFGIPYYKGAALIRMMEAFVTHNTFLKGLKNYLKKWTYKSVVQDDLFDILTEEAHRDGVLPKSMTVNMIMDPWTKQRGFPLVKVKSGGNNTVYFHQEKYSDDFMTDKESEFTWTIPISIETKETIKLNSKAPTFWMLNDTWTSKPLPHDESQWIVANADATGYFRVVYDKKLTQLLQTQLIQDHSVFSPFTKSQLLDDYFTLAHQGEVEIEDALSFTQYLGNETEYVVWTVFFRNLQKLYNYYQETSTHDSQKKEHLFDDFKTYLGRRVEQVLRKIGLEQKSEDSGATVVFRVKLYSWACRFSMSICFDQATKYFNQWRASNGSDDSIPIDLQHLVYCYGVAAGEKEEWAFAFDQFLAAEDSRKRHHLARSLGCSRNAHALEKVLDTLWASRRETEDDNLGTIFDSIASNPVSRHVAYNFIKKRLEDTSLQYGKNARNLPILFSALTQYLYSENDLRQMTSLLRKYEKTMEKAGIKESMFYKVSNVEKNMIWMIDHFTPMRVWFKNVVSE